MPLPTNRTATNTVPEHVSDHNILHGFYNAFEGFAPASFATTVHSHTVSQISDFYDIIPAHVYTPFMFGGEGDGIADDSSAVQQAFDAAADGGTVLFPPGTAWLWNDDIEMFRATAQTMVQVEAHGAELIYGGSGAMLTYDGVSASSPTQRGPQVRGGTWEATADAHTCFWWKHCGRSQFDSVAVQAFGAEANGGPVDASAWRLTNTTTFSENCYFTNLRINGGARTVTYESSGFSFARQRWINIQASGGRTGDWLFVPSGNVYDSTFQVICGNIGATATAVFKPLGGGNTYGNIKYEGGGPPGTTAIFDLIEAPFANEPVVYPPIPLRDDIALVINGDQLELGTFRPFGGIDLDMPASLHFQGMQILNYEQVDLAAATPLELTAAHTHGTFLISVSKSAVGNPRGLWALTKRHSTGGGAVINSLADADDGSGNTFTFTWDNLEQPKIACTTAITDVEIMVVRLAPFAD